ncbi:MAG: SDR family NAD(P)-dependent oxidoreductase [Candidatus Limnocylindrales bacterium]
MARNRRPRPPRSPGASTTSGWRARRPTASRPGPWPRPRFESIRKSGLEPADIALFIPHQANIRIIEAVAKGLDLPMDKMFVNLDKYGNTSAASVPIALAEAVNSGRVKVGDRIVLVAFGAGFTSGAVTIEWTADPARGIAGDAAVNPDDVRVRLPIDWDLGRPHPGSIGGDHGPAGHRGRASRRCRPGRPGRGSDAGGSRVIDLTGKSALVTGGSRGIGRAIVIRLATQGADVAFTYKGNDVAAAETTGEVEDLGRRAISVKCDVRDIESAEALGQGRAGGVREGRHPGQQRGHHPGRPDHAHVAPRPGGTSSRPTCSARSG